MLSQNFIPRSLQQTTDLTTGTQGLISELQERLEAGEYFDNLKLTEITDKEFGGTRAQGRYTSRDAYDALEVAVNKRLETSARELMRADFNCAVKSILRPLIERLPRQSDRTLEQTELQQFSTPPTIAYLVARLLNPQSIDRVLEPSAGTGSLAIWPRSVGAATICNEINPRRYALLTGELRLAT